MKYILLRDDDLCYFSCPESIDETYGFLLQAGVPLNFSVIPCVDASATTNSEYFGRGTYEPFIPAVYQGQNELFPIIQNPALVTYIRNLRNIEILQHGYSHNGRDGKYEFETDDHYQLSSKIRNGQEILLETFGHRPSTFVAPQDQYSQSAFTEISKNFDIFSLGWLKKKNLPLRTHLRYYVMKLRGQNFLRDPELLTLEHPGIIFSKYRNTTTEVTRFKQYVNNHRIIVLALHHWEFYNDQKNLDTALHGAFVETIEWLTSREDCAFVNFRDLSKLA